MSIKPISAYTLYHSALDSDSDDEGAPGAGPQGLVRNLKQGSISSADVRSHATTLLSLRLPESASPLAHRQIQRIKFLSSHSTHQAHKPTPVMYHFPEAKKLQECVTEKMLFRLSFRERDFAPIIGKLAAERCADGELNSMDLEAVAMVIADGLDYGQDIFTGKPLPRISLPMLATAAFVKEALARCVKEKAEPAKKPVESYEHDIHSPFVTPF